MRTEIIRTITNIDSVTKKYVYSTEVITYKTLDYFVACRHHWRYDWGGERRAARDCTRHSTREAAEAAIAETARLWDWKPETCYIIEQEGTDYEIKHHRNKVRG